MLRVGPYVFKRADDGEEFEQIHRLNYRTFVSEIPQHADSGDGRLIDKYHDKNNYFIALHDGRLVAMLSAHDQPPFSVAERLPNPEVLQLRGRRPLEVRLLAVEPDKRKGTVFFGLLCVVYNYAAAKGYTHIFISGLQERLLLYQRLGFEPLGPAVASGQAWFVPMVLTVGQLPKRVQRVKELWEAHVEHVSPQAPGVHATGLAEPFCLLPGPVTMAQAVRQAFQQLPIYHRGPEFIALFQKVRRTLCRLVNARGVALKNGSGTLANEAVAACLAADRQNPKARGVLLVNGEFGERLARQATRFGLQPRILRRPWGQPWDLDEVDTALAEEAPGSWVWGVHLESSTGVLNDLCGLVRLAKKRGVRVCLDCISSLGAVPIDLEGVYLATGASGKSLGSYAGVAIIFADPKELSHLDMSGVPSYLDIPAALANEGPRFTFPSPTLQALATALEDYSTPDGAKHRYETYAEVGRYVREQLCRLGLGPLAGHLSACPVVTTFAPPGAEASVDFVNRCLSWGFAIGGQSSYLAERRLVQVATMGAVRREDCEPLFHHLHAWLERAFQKEERSAEGLAVSPRAPQPVFST